MASFDLSSKVAVVTGGNGGIGFGMARAMAQAGASIVVAARNAEKSRAAVEELTALGAQAIAIEVDVADEVSVNAMIDGAAAQWGRLDILVNNAGTNIRKRPELLSLAEWRLILDTNLTSVFLASKAAYPHFQAAGGGKIINIGSMYSVFGAPSVPAYAASKGGVVQLTKALATAWAEDHVQVNAVLPGFIETELTDRARRDIPGLYERVLSRLPDAHWGNGDDLGGIAVFLASAASDYITGVAIPVDGGYVALG